MILRACDVEEFIIRAKDKEVVCWGAGNWLSVLTDRFGLGIEKTYSYVVDSNPILHGTIKVVNGQKLTVRSPQYLLDNLKPNTIILITVFDWQNIRNLIENNHIFRNTECYPALVIFGSQIDKLTYSVDLVPNDFRMNKKQQIPKIIHYIWFSGEPLPPEAINYIESWKKHCPDYEIIEWNESNYDLAKHPYVRQAIEEKKWAFAGDYVRLDVVYNYGGIYLDIDVELLRNLDDLLYNDAYFGFHSIELINPGSNFGCIKGHPTIRLLRDAYDDVSFYNGDGSLNLTISPCIQTESMEKLGLKLNGEFQIVEDIAVYPALYFDPIGHHRTNRLFATEETYSIHHYFGSWTSDDERSKASRDRDSIRNVLDSEARIQGGKQHD